MAGRPDIGRPARATTCDSGEVTFPAAAAVPADPADAPPGEPAAPGAELAVEPPALSERWAEARFGALPEAARPEAEPAPCEALAVEPPALSGHWSEARPAMAQISGRAPAGHARPVHAR